MKKPVIISLTIVCAPKPTATPTTPAPAKIADTLMPKRESIDVSTINHTT